MTTPWKTALLPGLLMMCALAAQADDTNTPAKLRLNIFSPLDYQVVQRSTRDDGRVVIAGVTVPAAKNGPLPDALEVRVTGSSARGDYLAGNWQPLPCDARVAAFRGEITVPAGGWYQMEIRAVLHGTQVAIARVKHVGVGEVFVIAGQSNSANYGEERQTNTTRRVAAFDGIAWQPADDPEPGAGGTKGSFIPAFGDLMVSRFNVPVGIVATGIGSTSVREWLPAGTRLSNLPPLTRNVVTVGAGEWEAIGKIFADFTTRMRLFGPAGFRAVLWHQGESDARQADPERTLPGKLYREYLEQLIRSSRKEVGWEMPWFVAQVSYHNPSDVADPDIRAAQKSLWDSGVAIEGPDTDALTGGLREKQGRGIHLSAAGLREHGRLWAGKVGPWLDKQLGPQAQ